ncbi:MAG: hypothetical protein J2O48_11460 [Solirubrobacterales bacterium]|nr:hypothetical protein [Solirubrobacterales bacterium]
MVALGISDSDAPTVTEPHWDGLGIDRARVVVPFDVALATDPAGTRRREEWEAYRQNAAAKGVGLLVAFEATSSSERVAPDPDTYTRALEAFAERYPDIAAFTPWNEPNNRDTPHYVVSHDAKLAAEYWLRARATWPESVPVTAGDFAGIPGDPYVAVYQRHLKRNGARPDLWAIHAHSDLNSFQVHGDRSARITRDYLKRLRWRWSDCRIWLTEYGARYRDAQGKIWGDESQAQTMQFLLGLPQLDKRIDAIYYYNYSNQCSIPSRCAMADTGVVSPAPFNGEPPDYDERDRPRAAYKVLADRGPVIEPR